MARIVSYKYDNTITDGDAWIGTDRATLSTRQFTALAVADYLNTNSKVQITGQMDYKYVMDELGGTGTFSLPGGGQQNQPFNSLSSITIATTDYGGQNVVKYLEYLINYDIIITEKGQISNFGHYSIDSYTPNGTNASYYDLSLTFKGGNGQMDIDTLYSIMDFAIAGASDKHFTFTQSAPLDTWVINHNLNKYPSVSVTNFNDVVIVGEVEYTALNTATVTFTSPVAGKAFLN